MSGEDVSFTSDNPLGNVPGVLFDNPSEAKEGLIVLHEWWGRNEQITKQGSMMSEKGKLAILVLDLYRGKVAIDKETAGHYMGGLNWDGAMQDLQGAARFLKSRGCVKVGVTGFCMGGALSLAAAVTIPGDISAAAPFYGIPNQEKYDLTKITIPIQAHFAEDDEIQGFSSKEDYTPAIQKMVAAGVPVELYEYKAGHAFMNPENKIGDNYREAFANQAYERLYEFMHKNLA